jgi:ribosomal-protein-alanine N-acetyltransferase
MSEQPLPFQIKAMTSADIPQVIAIEHASYAMSWPKKAYDYELKKNKLAHYFVLHLSPSPPDGRPQAVDSVIIGLGGFWLMVDDIHITTIAIDPSWRRQGLGEWMLITLLEAGQTLGGKVATLEVRPSNHAALSLYHKYSFQNVGRRSHYYTDNDEDALIYTTPTLSLPNYQAMLQQRKTTLQHRLTQIKVDKNRHIN